MLVLAVMPALLLAGAAQGAPYVPQNGAEIIERVPARNDAGQQELRRLRERFAAEPGNVSLASELARRYIEAGRSDGDPRYLGYARATLARWIDQDHPPPEVLILRATLQQSQHQFGPALKDLDRVLRADPRHPQAWLTRATILQVQADYAAAMNSCMRLYGLAPELIAATCLASVTSLHGESAKSYASLRAVLAHSNGTDAGIETWVRTLLGEMAARIGNDSDAESQFRQALALDAGDNYLLGAYADFLLERGRPAEVAALLKPHVRSDGLLLRYALAMKAQNDPRATQHVDTLRARFAAATLRQDSIHDREQARFELHLLNRPERALEIAQRNWETQKEPADARILLEAARATQDRNAAQPVLAWLRQTGLEDRALASLAADLGEAE